MAVATWKRTGCFPPALGSFQLLELASASLTIPQLASFSPSRLSPQPHPGVPGAPSINPASYSHAIFLGWQCWPLAGLPASIAFFFCPTFYFENVQTIRAFGRIVQGTVVQGTLPRCMRVPGGGISCPVRPEGGHLCTPGHGHAQLFIPGQHAGPDAHPYPVAHPHGLGPWWLSALMQI